MRPSRVQERHGVLDGCRDGRIARGALPFGSGTEWLGTAMLVEPENRAAAEAMMADGPCASRPVGGSRDSQLAVRRAAAEMGSEPQRLVLRVVTDEIVHALMGLPGAE
jgi:hypothetical protein